MKSDIFRSAIIKRNKIKFLYNLNEVVLDPYFISLEKSGKKVLYGRMMRSNEIKKFEYSHISNIKILKNAKFSPVIPIIAA